MKKRRFLLSATLFAAAFAGSYVSLCYLVPGLRIKLAAPPAKYFVESIRHLALFKGTISLGAGLLAGAIPLIHGKKKETA